MTSLSGLISEEFTDIDVTNTINLNGNAGTLNQVIKSDGVNSDWGDVSSLVTFERLTADGSTITIGGSLTGNYNTQIARTIAVSKVPNSLTAGSNISFSSGSTYDGSSAITINATDTDTTYQGSATIDIDTATNPDTLSCIKVPNSLTAGSNISFSSGSTYDGSSAITINATDTDTTYQGGSNITIDTTTNPDTINLDTAPTNLNLTDSTNVIHPPNVFDVAGDLRMTIEMGNFLPNDDNSYFNIGVEDDLSAKIHGTIRVLTSSLEVCGYFVIPANYTATGVRIDVTNSSGVAVSRTITVASVTTYGGTGFTSLNYSNNSGAEFSLSSNMVGASDKIMLIKISTTATTDHIRGGYIKLTR